MVLRLITTTIPFFLLTIVATGQQIPTLNDLADVLVDNDVSFNQSDDSINALDSYYAIEGRSLVVSVREASSLKDYALPIGASLRLREETNGGFESVDFSAPAPNFFEYHQSVGMQWSPVDAFKQTSRGSGFVHVEPKAVGLTRFAWLVSDSGVSPDFAQFVIPSSVADELAPPIGYKWRHSNLWSRPPQNHNWYVPSGWEQGGAWTPTKLRYDFALDRDALIHYDFLKDKETEEHVEYISLLMEESFSTDHVCVWTQSDCVQILPER